jgi:predicted nucleotidyltransferase
MMVSSLAVEWVRIVAERLGDLREEVVFLGGATVGLLITDPAAAPVRPTKDVDVIVGVGSWGEYVPLQERLRDKGFSEDTEEGAPLCRWVIEGIKVDVMPTSAVVLGFSNRWYGPAMKTAQRVELAQEISIRLVTAPYFVATKLEAFRGRGEGDYQASHDLEDLIAVVDGRPELLGEIEKDEVDLRVYLREEVGQLLDDKAFRESLPGHLPGDAASQERLPMILRRFGRIAGRG